MLFWKVTVMLSPLESALVTRVEKTSVRTPVVPEPLITSASRLYVFPWLSALEPVQNSAASQTAVAGRHTVDAGRKASAGHVVLVPVQVSATSHAPAAARH